jgi:ferrous-iron efflux pump FieF
MESGHTFPVNAPLGAAEAQGRAARLLRLATYAAVGTALTLVLVKTGAWLLSGSIAVLSSLVDSVADVAASAINLLAVRHALTPADREHRFGHGKAEPLAALGQATFIAGSAVFLALEGIDRLMNPQPIAHAPVAIGVMLFSLAATCGLVLLQRHVARTTRSIAVQADSMHYLSDFLSNGATILALLVATQLGWIWADPVLGLAVAALILWSGLGIARTAFDQLMDRELPEADRARVREIALAHPKVQSIHDLRTRAAGTWRFIQFHMELDGDMTLNEAHAIADQVEAAVMQAFPGAEVIIHQDPAGIVERNRAPHAA